VHKLLLAIAILVLSLPVLVGCTVSDPLPDTLYTSDVYVAGSLHVNGVEVNKELMPPAIYIRWSGTSFNNNPLELGVDGVAGTYYTLDPHSAMAFKLLVVGRDDTADEIGVWKIDNGSIKRAGDNTAILMTSTTDTVIREDASWSISITGVPAADALNITVVGDATNEVKWSAVLYGVEVHY